ncbi:YtxH domain-containing protein [Candidatus Poribacteria bacterium]
MENGKNVGGVLLAFIAGGAVGAVLGLLLAPSSGAETRRKIKATSLDTRDKALEKVESVKSEASDLVDRGREKVEGVKSQIQSAVEAGKEAYTKKRGKLSSESEESEDE